MDQTGDETSAAARGSAGAEAHWFVARTRSRQEMILCDELRAMGVDHCLPVVTRRRRFGGYDASVEVPCFPGYVFLHGTPQDADLAVRTHRAADVAEAPDGSLLEWELTNLCRALRVQPPVDFDTCAVLPSRSRARIRSGPLAGIEGVVDSACGGVDHVVLQVTCIDQAVAARVDAGAIELTA